MNMLFATALFIGVATAPAVAQKVDFPQLTYGSGPNTTIAIISPSCGECIRFYNNTLVPMILRKNERLVIKVMARNSDDIMLIALWGCSLSKFGDQLHRYMTANPRISGRSFSSVDFALANGFVEKVRGCRNLPALIAKVMDFRHKLIRNDDVNIVPVMISGGNRVSGRGLQ